MANQVFGSYTSKNVAMFTEKQKSEQSASTQNDADLSIWNRLAEEGKEKGYWTEAEMQNCLNRIKTGKRSISNSITALEQQKSKWQTDTNYASKHVGSVPKGNKTNSDHSKEIGNGGYRDDMSDEEVQETNNKLLTEINKDLKENGVDGEIGQDGVWRPSQTDLIIRAIANGQKTIKVRDRRTGEIIKMNVTERG